jgi:mitochondrial intermediate peptidase
VFDSQPFWRDFSQNTSILSKKSGLIGNKYLTTPRGFEAFAESAIRKCETLVQKTLAASTTSEYRSMAKNLDRVSDLLCRVIDLSDFIRATHPDAKWARAATEAYSLVFEYMNVYNTETRLNSQLKKAMSMPEVTSQWTNEEKTVAEILMKDFARSGIDLPAQQREKFVILSNEISEAGTEFVNGMEFANDHVALDSTQLSGVDPMLVQKLSWWNKAVVPLHDRSARIVASTAHDEAARRAIYIADRTASKNSINRLRKLLLKRAQLAKLTGYTSYGQMTLVDKMAKTPEAVNNFLTTLNAGNCGQMRKEIDRLLQAKQSLDGSATAIQPWDHGFYMNRLMQLQSNTAPRTSMSRLYEILPSFFSPGSVIAGLSQLFHRLYGVRFVASPVPLGECWDPDVRRLDVITESQEQVAVLYCDLFARPGKPPNPAHFTLLCSRDITDEEIEEARSTGQHPNDGMPVSMSTSPKTGQTIHHQLPTIALVCDFPEPSRASGKPALLSLQSYITLFHEMGHAIHSILGRTTMQGIAGTRCATDFAELPSILMEYFATDPSVLGLFARHWETDAPMPSEMIEALRTQQNIRAETTGGWENENQILMAMLDQSYHSQDAVQGLTSGKYDTTAVFHRIWDEHGSVREPPGTAWQGFFGHLYGYGATYYSYLFDRAIARQVWRSVFWDGRMSMATNRDAGEKFKERVLKWGGGRDPWLCLEDLMGEGKGVLAEGGERAMLEVGKWGVGAGSEGAM